MITKFKKIVPFLIVLSIINILPCVSQTIETISGQEKTNITVSYEEMFDMFKSDMFEGIFGAILDHIWVVLLIFIAILLLLYIIIHYISKLLAFISNKFISTEYIEFGKLKIKNKSYNNSANMSKNLEVLDMFLKSNVENIFRKTIDIVDNLSDSNRIYENRCNDIFHETFSDVLNEFRDLLIEHCIEVTGFTLADIHRTREYFFINELIVIIENAWKRKSKDIIIRNGFENADSDLNYVRKYISELHQCVISSINYRYLESVEITRQRLLEIIKKCFEITDPTFEKMFKDLSKLKQSYIEKKNERKKQINDIIDVNIGKIIDMIHSILPIFSSNVPVPSNKHSKPEEKEEDSK